MKVRFGTATVLKTHRRGRLNYIIEVKILKRRLGYVIIEEPLFLDEYDFKK